MVQFFCCQAFFLNTASPNSWVCRFQLQNLETRQGLLNPKSAPVCGQPFPNPLLSCLHPGSINWDLKPAGVGIPASPILQIFIVLRSFFGVFYCPLPSPQSVQSNFFFPSFYLFISEISTLENRCCQRKQTQPVPPNRGQPFKEGEKKSSTRGENSSHSGMLIYEWLSSTS